MVEKQTQKMCGDATSWDEDEYRESILKEREIQTRTIFRTAWAPSRNPSPDAFVVASSDGTLASYSLSTLVSRSTSVGCYSDAKTGDIAEPEGLVKGHEGPAYDVKFYGDDESALLLSCGDDGRIRGWKWKEFSESKVPLQLHGAHVKPVLELTNPQHKGPWNSLSPMPEINAIAVDHQSGSIFSAAGDSHAYCWDVESSQIKMVFKGHSDYLHCVAARNTTNQVITGSEDGTARIWDCRTGKCIKVITPKKGLSSCVSCVALDERETWLVCGRGRSLFLWNLPASECVSTISVPALIQDVVFDENQILAVGAEPMVRRFDMTGTLLSQIQCAPQSSFSVALHKSGVVGVGGYGGFVDVISQFGSHLCTFRCNGL